MRLKRSEDATMSICIKEMASSSMRRPSIRNIARLYRQLAVLLDPYQPELHYMRGPGPKWQAKHAVAVVRSQVAGREGARFPRHWR
jgi:hypothetical protein